MKPTSLIDASVALTWFIASEDTAAGLALLEAHRVRAPDILPSEIRGVLRTLAAQGELSAQQLADMERRLSRLAIEMLPTDAHLREAFKLAQVLSEPVYACIYLALAIALDVPLVTADRPFCMAARRCPATARHVRHIGQAA